ncbi:SubName: Full=Uncharacterized protein {ECO:0000313/EMBL:CCA71992.1} [Serendipita indica DSM 11827]|nr:SubName: Full=Uncharacterized protein {ECO:0000313/EMBL:CCA71992.1} [Serendipita indica DSM 11827]
MTEPEAASSRTPVEIWEEILRHCVGLSLTDPVQSSLRGYEQHVFAEDGSRIYGYKRRERQRGILRLVSRRWKLVADEICDDIAFLHLDEGMKLPIDYKTENVKLMHYIACESSSALLAWDKKTDASPVIIGENASFFPITHVYHRDIVIPSPPFEHSILALRWVHPTRNSRWMETLQNSCFGSLVALDIAPLDEYSWNSFPDLTLPLLRFLGINACESNAQYLEKWHFHTLQYLSFSEKYNSSSGPLGPFLQRHSRTVEELKISTASYGAAKVDADLLASCTNGLPRLQTYITGHLGSLGTVIPHLITAVTSSTDVICRPERHLTIQMIAAEVQSEDWKTLRRSVLQLAQAPVKFRLMIESTWDERIGGLHFDFNKLKAQLRLMAMVRELKIDIFDEEGSHHTSEDASYYNSEAREM